MIQMMLDNYEEDELERERRGDQKKPRLVDASEHFSNSGFYLWSRLHFKVIISDWLTHWLILDKIKYTLLIST